MILKIERWKLWAFLCYTLIMMVSMYGHGINRVKADIAPVVVRQEIIIDAQKYLVDSLLIESGREPMYFEESEMDAIWEEWNNNELFNKENWLDG